MPTGIIALFRGPGRPFEFEEHPLPETLAPGEILVELTAATICGSDVRTYLGKRNEPVPSVLGHEGVGRVQAVGAGRDAGLIGASITWSIVDACGFCAPCTDWDLPQKCRSLFKYGHAPFDGTTPFTGCYATHLVVRPGTAVHRVANNVPAAALATANCALATIMAVTEHFPRPCRTAVVQGAGLLGLYAAAVLRSRGVERVIVVDIAESRLAHVAGFGGEPALHTALELCREGEADVAFELSGAPSVVSEGMRLLRPGGHYVLAGMVHPGSHFEADGEVFIRKCLTVRGVHNYAPRHLAQAAAFLATSDAAALPWSDVLSPVRKLIDLDAAFSDAVSGRWPRVAVFPGGVRP
jgi:putative phosphonate catabolism associated alcohol dehydrogenase